jgi:hypothetical protein
VRPAEGEVVVGALAAVATAFWLALKAVWSRSRADVVAYMDVDLSTNLKFFPLLIHGLSVGYDLAVGSRVLQASQTRRSLKREVISRGYNRLVKLMFWNHFSDAQCGFKLKIFEVPVEWVEDLDSRVHIVRTALEDVRGLVRLRLGGLRQVP